MRTYTTENGIEITLTQQAYISGTLDNPYYEASAEDADGNSYSVRWDILDDYNPEDMDESSACDWDEPSDIIAC